MKNQELIDYYKIEMSGDNKVEVYTEVLDSPCALIKGFEFNFKINDSTSRKNNLFIHQLYKILVIIQNALKEVIDKKVLPALDGNVIQIYIESEDDDKKLEQEKQRLYGYYLKRLIKTYNDTHNDCVCTCTPDESGNYYLTFFKKT